MSSMVSEYIIRPALQQVRRFSRSSVASEPEPLQSSQGKAIERPASHEDAISETEEESYVRDEGDESTSQPASSRSSVAPNLGFEAAERDEYRGIPEFVGAQDGETRQERGDASGANSGVPGLSHSSVQNIATVMLDFRDTAMSALGAAGPSTEVGNADREAASSPMIGDRKPILPEDDGMGALRKRIHDIQARDLPATEKARLMHQLLSEGYKKPRDSDQPHRPDLLSSSVSFEQKPAQGPLESLKFWQNTLGEQSLDKYVLTEEDIRPTFAPLKPDEDDSEYRALGCEHYKRNVKLQCFSCNRWYNCRFCHDKMEDHPLARKDTKNMLCMFCGTAQKAGEACVSCGELAANYYCDICKLWDNDPDKNIYHCNDCGICRIGRGLGKDFFHCKKCCACLSISIEKDHKCIERSIDCDCPICGDYMFNSVQPVCFMKCAHAIHRHCYNDHIKNSYKCPICSKSVVNMESQWRNLDMAIEAQPMPEPLRDTRAVILCNDCSAKTTVKYHWLALKCAVCLSYNTHQYQILGDDGTLETEAATIPNLQMAESTMSGIPNSAEGSNARDIPRRRRHSSSLMHTSNESLDLNSTAIGSYVVQDRLARSASPTRMQESRRSTVDQQAATEDSDEEEDMIGFWRRVPIGIISDEDHEDELESDDESVSSLTDEMEDDEDEDEDEITLFGHR